MFDFIRNHQRWMQLILLLLILPSFAFFGVQSYTRLMSSEPELASVDGQSITLGEFNRARRTQLEQYRSMMGGQFDAAAVDTPEFREQVLNTLIDQRVVAAAASQGRYTVSDETLRRAIAAIPALQQDGQFSPERYRQVLAAQGMTPPTFEASMRHDLALAQVLEPIGSSAAVPAEVAAKLLALLTEQRTVARQLFAPEAFEKGIVVSDADIQAWYDANSAKLQVPENVDVDYIVIDEGSATRDIKVTDADIESFYKQNQARYGQPERRRVSHILIEIPSTADDAAKARAHDLAADLAKRAAADPGAFAALAKEFSQDTGSAKEGGDLGWISKSMLVPQVEDAVFKQPKGVPSGVVESPFGLHVILVTDIQPVSVKPLAEVREDIALEIRKQLAAARFAEQAGKLTSLIYDQRDSLKPIADALGVPINKGLGLTRDGLLPPTPGTAAPSSAEQAILGNPKVRQAAFSSDVLKEKLNSGAIELSPDTIVALRVSAIHPAHVPALADVTARIRSLLVSERALAAAREAGVKRLEALRDGKASPQGFDAPVTVTRQDPQSLTREQLAAVMTAHDTSLPAYIGVEGSGGYAVMQILKIEPGPAPQAGQVAQFRGQLSQAWGAAEELAALRMLRQVYSVKMLPDAAKVISGQLDAAQL